MKWFSKKRPKELISVHDNLDTYLAALNSGTKPIQLTNLGFVHPEQRGVVAIDQKGGGPGLAECRLYVYPDEQTEVLHVLLLTEKKGKKQQNQDVQACVKFVESLKKASN